MDEFIIIGIIALALFTIIGLFLTLKDKDWNWLIVLALIGVILFAICVSFHFDIKNDTKDYQEKLDNLDKRIIVINSLNTIENKTNESIQLIVHYIDKYNSYFQNVIKSTKKYHPELLNKYQNYYYIEYDYVTNSISKIPLNEN